MAVEKVKEYLRTYHMEERVLEFDGIKRYRRACCSGGWVRAGVCPFAVREGVRAYLDEVAERFETVYPAAGSANSAVRLTPRELEHCIENVTWIDVCK